MTRALPFLIVLLLPGAVLAQSVAIDLGQAGQPGATARLVQLTALIGMLSLAPSLLVMATAFGLWFRRVNGRVRDTSTPVPMAGPDDPPAAIETMTPESVALAEALSGRLGERATIVQFSSAFCQPSTW